MTSQFQRGRRNLRLRYRPALECLEDRSLLSTNPSLLFPDLEFDPNRFRSDRLLVGVPNAGHRDLALLGTLPYGTGQYISDGVIQVDLPFGMSFTRAYATFQADSRFTFVQPDFTLTLSSVPNDPRYFEQWGLNNLGGYQGLRDADIDATDAWAAGNTGNPSFVVAVVDSGMDLTHPDLRANLWTNPNEIPGNGIDDDGNGFIDDVHGWDFFDGDNDPSDANGHGTHVAGTIGAVGNNSIGVTGVAWNIKLMPLKIGGAGPSVDTSAAIKAIDYAVRMGVKVSNHSWGGSGINAALETAIRNARNAGHLIVAAAGNDGRDTNQVPVIPANIDLDNIISVAASTRQDTLAGFSNFGSTSVDLAAPGEGILSTYLCGSYKVLDGTSMASPHVAAAAALVWQKFPNLTYLEVRQKLFDSVDVLPAFQGVTVTGGRLNLARALDVVPSADVPRFQVIEIQKLDRLRGELSQVRVRFSEAVNPATFGPEDVAVTIGRRVIQATDVRPVSPQNLLFDITIPPQRDVGEYAVAIGPNITSAAGAPLDQDGNGQFDAERDTAINGFDVGPYRIFASAQNNVLIPDRGRATSRLTVNERLYARNIYVEVTIDHPNVSDLRVYVVTPWRRAIELVNRRGGAGGNFAATIFADDAATSVSKAAAPFNGKVRPEIPLNVLNEMSAQGNWQLIVHDDRARNVGRIRSWRLEFEGKRGFQDAWPTECPPAPAVPGLAMARPISADLVQALAQAVVAPPTPATRRVTV